MSGRIALITGAARGQGRSHAVRLAEEGADIIAVDSCRDFATVPYAMATPDDLTTTVQAVEATGRRIVALEIDVRDQAALSAGVSEAAARLGGLDTVVANAGVISFGALESLAEDAWQDVIDINLTGAWHTAKAAIPHLRARGGGAITITSSVMGLMPAPGIGHYVTTKHGVIGLMRTLAVELAQDMIRVNCVNPTNVDTEMLINPVSYEKFAPDLAIEDRTDEALIERFTRSNLLPIPWVESVDVSNAVLWLSSDEARYVTGVALPVDAGCTIK
ncbi:mycofactocin-coupled SDR family oxidoreductase [Microbacterium sp. X-17]|uniref:mycofactocin-coupled SDR family oxidoreductase n=1 Tax=Microbacterium sp. X-17 TaxID=3144404 RepID=UPI0031F53301